MKTKILVITVIVLAAVCVRERYLHLGYKKSLIHSATYQQIEAIQDRARAFMEFHYGNSHLSGGVKVRYLEDYEVTVKIPEDKKKEFLEWMKAVSFQSVSVDRFPNAHGAKQDEQKGQLSYRVYYGDKPDDW